MSGLAYQRDDYLDFCEGVRRLTGIDLGQYKRPQMERRIRSFAESRGAASLPDYLRRLSDDRAQLESFLDRMTINVSQLWRNPEQWDRIATSVLPELAEAGRIRSWSAGCSYGAEAYTLAALCRSTVPSALAEVHGTDIDGRMVERARAGVFSEADARSAPPAELKRWFDRTENGDWQARAELRMLTRFETGDLLRDRFPRAGYDLVLVPQRRHLLHRAGARRAPCPACRVPPPRRVPADRLHRADHRPGRHGARAGPSLPLPESVMDTSEYMSMFLAESREHLDALNLAVIRIEETPDDRDTLDEIFRTAHSLKGMSATMGFAQIAALTHKMEDVFEVLRGRTEGVGRSAIDVLLECLDALSGAVESIAEEGAESLDPAALIVRLESLLRDEDAAARAQASAGAAPSIDLPEGLDGVSVAHVRAELAAGVMMPSVRAYMVLAALGDHGELIGSAPSPEAVETFDGSVIEAWLATDHEHSAIEKTVLGVPDVGRAVVRDHTAAAATAASPAAPATAKTQANRSEPGRKAAATVRVDAERLDQLMHLMGELVVNRTTVESLAGNAHVEGLSEAMQDLTRSSQALQALVMRVRMIPVEAVFLRFPRLVRDLSSKFGKQVELVLTGQDTELDRTVVDMLGDPLVHLVRNSLDHGLEMPDERHAAGKQETGVLEIAARHAGGNVVITVRDDGRGVDPARVARKALRARPDHRRPGRRGRHGPRDRAAVLGRFLDRRGDQRHLRPRRRHGRGSQRHPRARRRCPDDVRSGHRHHRAHPAAADAGDHAGPADRGQRARRSRSRWSASSAR